VYGYTLNHTAPPIASGGTLQKFKQDKQKIGSNKDDFLKLFLLVTFFFW